MLLTVIGIDTFRNIAENIYFGLYFGGKYGVFPQWTVDVFERPELLILPKITNVVAGCVVLGLLFFHWLPLAVREWEQSQERARDLQTLAAIDPLTNLYNRRQFETLARAELARCQRYMRPCSVAERIRSSVFANAMAIEDSKLTLTISLGVSEATASSPSVEAVLRYADQALYEAKQTGRNRVCVAKRPLESVARAAE